MNTDKIHIQHAAAICKEKGIEYAVISPGSRCAPLTIAFNRQEGIECISVIDERSAAFVALGIAQQTEKPVVLICTSGSAILNYAPALAEAFYQKIPLLVLSADRPNEWIDQGENQSIQQFEVYKNYIKKSFQLPLQIGNEKDLWYSDRIVSEAINTCMFPDFGPVHINIPLREPLYNLTENIQINPKVIDFDKPHYEISEANKTHLKSKLGSFSKILIVAGGQRTYRPDLEKALQAWSNLPQVVVLKEATSNVYGSAFIDQIDQNIEIIVDKQRNEFNPQLVITFGGGVVSKKIKFWLRNAENITHWHITKSFEHWDIFQALSSVYQVDIVPFLKDLLPEAAASNYQEFWQTQNTTLQTLHAKFVKQLPYNDYKVYGFLLEKMQDAKFIHFGNSTPIRYANLCHFSTENKIQINANRGVSGIDGVLSTALGASLVHAKDKTYCICGDVAALYDSNALMNHLLHPNFKIIIINNQGGNIFKIIPGPDKLDELDNYFTTKHQWHFEHLAAAFNCFYAQAHDLDSLEKVWDTFNTHSEKCAILEIKTPSDESAASLRNFFAYIKEAY